MLCQVAVVEEYLGTGDRAATDSEAPDSVASEDNTAVRDGAGRKVVMVRERELLSLEDEFHSTSETLVKQMAWIANYLGRLTKHISGDGLVKPPDEPAHADFMRILRTILKKTQQAEVRARQCLQSIFGQQDLAPRYFPDQQDSKASLWTNQCNAPELILALQTTLTATKKDCQTKVSNIAQEKEEALVKCSREWKRAIRTAAKRMNKDPSVPSTNPLNILKGESDVDAVRPTITAE